MGYKTTFTGCFQIDKPLSYEQIAYLKAFSKTRRMNWGNVANNLPDHLRQAVGLPFGEDGEYYVGASTNGPDALDSNAPPNKAQPGRWCQWGPTVDGSLIEWDKGGEDNFYNWEEWLEYIVKHFLKPWGYKLNGEIIWQGEDPDDTGRLCVKDNIIDSIPDIPKWWPVPAWWSDSLKAFGSIVSPEI